jgi:DNA-binding NarL/FixJ family response regulator
MVGSGIQPRRSGSVRVRVLIEVHDPALREDAQRLVSRLKGINIGFVPDVLVPGLVEQEQRSEWQGLTARGRAARDVAVRRAVIGAASDAHALVNAALAGAWALVPADSASVKSSLSRVVEEIADGRCPILRQISDDPVASSLLLSKLAAARAVPEQRQIPNPLSPLEADILSRISSGHTSGRIAEDMGFHLQTVKNKVTAILSKTGAHTRGQAAAVAQANGWIDPP